MIKLVHEDTYFRAELEPRDGLYRIARSTKGFVDLSECEASHQALARALGAGPKGARLILDLREAPSRNDPEFEAVVGRYRKPIFDHCSKVAVLVRTQVGKLQIARMHADAARSLGETATVQVFDDEDRAFDWVLE